MEFEKSKLRQAIARAVVSSKASVATTLFLVPVSAAIAQAQQSEPERRASTIEEVLVTASRRTANVQDIPITITALSEANLRDLGIGNFEDYVHQLPGVTLAGQGPGRNEVFIRGVSAGRGAVRIAGLGQEPNVAIYVDEAPVTVGGRNVDVYATDLERIEVLKGPQGTLFGASSQTGTVRLITNKPVLDEFQSGGVAGLSTTRGGNTSSKLEGYINIPVVEDKLALRFAGYNVTEGGYIDNIAGTKQLPLENPGLGDTVPEFREEISNLNIAESDFNEVTHRGLRSSLYYEINPDWNFHLQHLFQNQETEGIFEVQPELSEPGGAQFSTQAVPPGEAGEFSTQTFSPDRGDDDLNHTTWTLNGRLSQGRLAGLELIYTGSYMDREFEGTQDYTGYANVGGFIPYYVCTYPGYAECFSPQLFVNQFFGVKRQVHQFRFATPEENRWRLIAGTYYEDTETTERGDFTYVGSIPAGLAPNPPVPGATSSNPDTRQPGVTFFNDFIRDREEISGFGEISFDILENLTATFGARHYRIEIGLAGNSSFASRAENNASGINVDSVLEGQSPTTLDDTIFKGNLSWQATDELLLYATFSEGFRAGAFNRNGTGTTPQDIPFFFESDELQNFEIGWKSRWLGGALQFNGAAFFMDFSDIQTQVLDLDISFVSFTDNVADAEIWGAEFDLGWFVTDELSTFLAFSYNNTEVTKVPPSVVNLAPEGSDLAQAPEFEVHWRARYETQVWNDLLGFAQVTVNYTDDSFSDLTIDKRFPMESYTQVDIAAEVSNGQWRARLFIDNVNDKFGELFVTDEDNILRVRPTRPRTFGVEFGYDL